MKKEYNQPSFEIERFICEDILTNSGIGAGDGVIDNFGDSDSDEGFIPQG